MVPPISRAARKSTEHFQFRGSRVNSRVWALAVGVEKIKASSNTGYGLSWRAGCVSEFGLLRLPFWLKFGFSNSLFVVVVFVAMAPPPQPPADRGAGPPIPRRRPRRPCSCIPPAPPSYPPTSPRRPDPRPNTWVVSVYTQALASDRSTRA